MFTLDKVPQVTAMCCMHFFIDSLKLTDLILSGAKSYITKNKN